MGGWGKIIGYLRAEENGRNRRTLLLISLFAIALAMFPAIMAELRHASFSGSPQTYLYLEVGGTLLSFCYAANALVRFRGTHDRTALILAFGFVISGIIETAGYFGLNETLSAGHQALSTGSHRLDGWPHPAGRPPARRRRGGALHAHSPAA